MYMITKYIGPIKHNINSKDKRNLLVDIRPIIIIVKYISVLKIAITLHVFCHFLEKQEYAMAISKAPALIIVSIS